MAAVLELTGRARELGLRLLRLRCGVPPWHLHDEAPNQQFLAHLGSLGIDPGPWLDPHVRAVYTASTGRKVHLAMERDPLEVLQMGAYFETCLSPGSFNFFSAVANATDVNKGVVFARDDAGRVIGRCLLAITEDGGLLTFRRYCHDPEAGFDRMVEDFATSLAPRMGTIVLQRGKVPDLVADAWYDDGAVDLCSRMPCLEDGSDLRMALPSIDLSEHDRPFHHRGVYPQLQAEGMGFEPT